MKNSSEENCCKKEFYSLNSLEKYKLLRYRIYEKKILDVYQLLKTNNFEVVLIKGWAAAENYPKPFLRPIGDIDLAVNPNTFLDAVALTTKLQNGEIDLHRGLRHLDTLEWSRLFENSRSKKIDNANLKVLCPEDHLRVLCVHWLIDGGAKKDKLWDIYYAVENRPADFDWDRCLNVVSETRRKWILCTIGLAQKYLGLSLKDTPLAGEKIEIPNWLIKALEKEWRSGILLKPLQYCLRDKRELWRQIKKRMPPNPIQATIDMEGEFDEKSRIKYQIGDIFYRLKLSLKRIALKCL